jgi:hypothetical protein
MKKMKKVGQKIVAGRKLMLFAKREVGREKIDPPISSGCSHVDRNYCSDHHDTT